VAQAQTKPVGDNNTILATISAKSPPQPIALNAGQPQSTIAPNQPGDKPAQVLSVF